MSDLHSFARDTEQSLDPLPFEVMIATRRRTRRRRAAVTAAAAVAAVAVAAALALAVAGLSQLGHKEIPARPAPQLLVPDWTADQIVGHPTRSSSSSSSPTPPRGPC